MTMRGNTAAGKALAGAVPRQAVVLVQRLAISTGIAAFCLWLMSDRLASIDLAALRAGIGAVQPHQWAAASLATAISFLAVGQYDAVIHRHLATGVAGRDARRAGITAIAISQTVGAGVVTGALIRWRLMRGVSLWQATQISLAVALSFLAGWAVVTGAVLAVVPDAPFRKAGLATLALAAVLAGLGAIGPARLRLPNLMTQGRLIALTAVDVLAASAALWLLLPPETALPITIFLPAFLIALGAGLVTGAPGGVGPFELTLLALLPGQPAAPLIAAIMAWRLVAYALPALLGAAVAVAGPARAARGPDPDLRPVPAAHRSGIIHRAARAETGLARQGHLDLMQSRLGGLWLAGRTRHVLVGFFGPMGDHQPSRAGLRALARQAAAEARLPAVYKACPRTAARARSLGWRVLPLGAEAMIATMAFTTQGPARAGLRRKLRRAAAAGVTIAPGQPAGAAERAAIARLWARARRGERGFSMGRHDDSYLAQQAIFEARVAGRLVAFVSFHAGMREWTLDLMRHAADAPDGTMQALIAYAIADAAAQGICHMSLAASLAPRPLPRLLNRLAGRDDAGLAQFKDLFAPRWQPLYLCAPSWPALALAGAEIARAVHRPPPLRRQSAQDHHAEYAFASGGRAWHTGA
jgi:phosphatidylglycerol lysyltransferase